MNIKFSALIIVAIALLFQSSTLLELMNHGNDRSAMDLKGKIRFTVRL